MTDNVQTITRREWGTGFGTKGTEGKVLTNCFKVHRSPDGFIQQYDVVFSDTQVREKRVIMNYLVKHDNIFGAQGVGVIYDGQAIIYIPGQSAGPPIVHHFSEAEARGKPSRPDRPATKSMQVKITHARSINMIELAEFMQGRLAASGNLKQALNALNVAIKYQAQLDNPARGNTFYVRPEGMAKDLGAGLEVWGGYFTAIRPAINQIILNFDRAAGAFKKSGNVINVLRAALPGIRDPRDLECDRMQPRTRIALSRFLKNLTVALTFSRDPNSKFKIRKVSDRGASDFMFEIEEGRQENVAQYIERKYNTRLQYPRMPCVQLTKVAWYPLECVSILPGTQFLGKLSPEQVAEMIKFTTLKPSDNMVYLRKGMPHLNLGGRSPLLKAWNFDVTEKPITAASRILDPPEVVYADPSGQPSSQRPRDGQWDVKGKRPVKIGKPVDRWFVVVFADDNNSRDGFPRQAVEKAVSMFVTGCGHFGLQIKNQRPFTLHVGNTMDVGRAIKDAAKRAGFGPQAPPDLVVTFVATKSSPQYGPIKAACETQFGVPSQNLLISKMQKAGPQYYSNVALKVNVKLGGLNHYAGTNKGWLPGFDRTPTIVFGADVTHPGPGSLLPSIAGVVASHDLKAVEYSAEVRAQNSREEIIVDLENITFKLLKNFQRKTGKIPQRILFFRDGVADSQFDQVCREEIVNIKRALRRFPDGYAPPITYVICGKRHHFKMYPASNSDADRSGNVRPGTVVDREITHPYYADFYLMSHAGLLGTSKSTHYSVLLDEARLGPDQLQATAYQLAYIYARSTRSVSIASPAYYAHHVCFRARHHIGDQDGAPSEAGSADAEQVDQMREQQLSFARARLANGISASLQGSLYWM